MKKLFPNQAEAIANSLYAILEEKKRATRVLERCVEDHPKWGARDRNLLYNACFEIIRWKRKYNYIAGLEEHDFSPWPSIKTWCILNDYSLPGWKEMDCPPFKTKEELMAIEFPSTAIAQSYPDWLFKLGKKELKNQWEKEAIASNQKAGIALRVNRLLASPKKIAQSLKDNYQLETEIKDGFPDALFLSKGRKLNKNPLFKQGNFEIQDANSQSIAPFCQVAPGMKVIDLCAGAGGKTLHLASLMRNKGALNAFDIEVNKLRELEKRIKRAKVKIVQSLALPPSSSMDQLNQWADRVLIDAPCSGLGTLKRNPEIKWNLTQEQLKDLLQAQRDLMLKGAAMLRPGGALIYATCSILPSENQEQTAWFLDENPNFRLDGEKIHFPSESAFDGFYMVRLVKEEKE
jgi:16S rRNA (cytosine967-C5)-methyltransferase